MSLCRMACGLGLSLAVIGLALGLDQPPVRIKIIALNDFHGNLQSPGTVNGTPVGGIDVLAGYVADLKGQTPNHVVVSAGDLIGASPLISALFHDEGTIETMNRLGLAFNAVGNHEFDEGKDELLRMQNGGCHPSGPDHSCQGSRVGTPTPFEGATFQFLAANVVDSHSGKTLFPPYGIKHFAGLQVAFIGLTLQATPAIVTPSGVAGLQFTDEAETVNALIPTLQTQGVEAIVVLIHQGGAQTMPSDRLDSNACAGHLAGSAIQAIVSRLNDAVDVVISGHTHQAYICQLPNAVGRAIPVTSANAFGRLVTDIDMQLDPHSGQVLDVTAHNIVVDRSNTALTPSATIASIVAGYDRLVAPVAHQVIGSITADIPNRKTAACDVPAGHLIADAQLAATRSANFGAAQIALMNPGGVRASGFVYTPARGSEPAGDITYAEAFTAQPFGNSLVTMTLTAQQVKDVLEQQFAGCQIPGQPARTVTRVLLPSRGFQFTWDATRPACEKIVTVALMADGVLDTLVDQGVVRQPTRPYRVTVNSYLAAGGDGFSLFKAGTERLGGAQDIDALVAYFAAFKRPHPAYDPQAPDLAQPRISRADSGTTCP